VHTVSRMPSGNGKWRVVLLTGDRAYDVFLDATFDEAFRAVVALNGGNAGWIPSEEWAREHASR